MYDVRCMRPDELEETLELIRSVFLRFESPDYSDEGTNTFLEFIEKGNIQNGINKGELKFWVCNAGSGIVGVIAMKNECHICMLFVHKNFHRQGISKRLVCEALSDVVPKTDITVNSSPYAKDFYHAVGFDDTDSLTTTNGIIYVPMKAKCAKIISMIENSYN